MGNICWMKHRIFVLRINRVILTCKQKSKLPPQQEKHLKKIQQVILLTRQRQCSWVKYMMIAILLCSPLLEQYLEEYYSVSTLTNETFLPRFFFVNVDKYTVFFSLNEYGVSQITLRGKQTYLELCITSMMELLLVDYFY